MEVQFSAFIQFINVLKSHCKHTCSTSNVPIIRSRFALCLCEKKPNRSAFISTDLDLEQQYHLFFQSCRLSVAPFRTLNALCVCEHMTERERKNNGIRAVKRRLCFHPFYFEMAIWF